MKCEGETPVLEALSVKMRWRELLWWGLNRGVRGPAKAFEGNNSVAEPLWTLQPQEAAEQKGDKMERVEHGNCWL